MPAHTLPNPTANNNNAPGGHGIQNATTAHVAQSHAVPQQPITRVIPDLLSELRKRTQNGQYLHLHEFRAKYLPEIWNRLDVTPEEVEEFLLTVIVLMRRRDGLSEFQRQLNNKVSDVCFNIFCDIFGQQTLLFPLFVKMMKQLLKSVDLTDEHYYKRAELPHMVRPDVPSRPHSALYQMEYEASLSRPTSAGTPRGGKRGGGGGGPLLGDDGEDLERVPGWLFTFDCLPDADRGGLSEAQYNAMVDDFHRLDKDRTGELDISELMSSNGVIGGKMVSNPNILRALDLDHSGRLSLMEILLGFFQDVPTRYIERRLRGLPLPDDWRAVRIPPDPYVSHETELGKINLRLSQAHRSLGLKHFSKEIVVLMKQWFDSLDVDGSGEISLREAALSGYMLGAWKLDASTFKKSDQDKTGALSFNELLRALFTGIKEEVWGPIAEEVIRESKAQWALRIHRKQQEDDRWADIQRRKLEDKIKQKILAGEDPDDLDAVAEELRLKAERQERLFNRLQRQRILRMEQDEIFEQQRRLLAQYMKEVPLVYTAEDRPPEAVKYGIKITQETFHLDHFINNEDTRNSAIRLLRRFDLSGMNPAFFCGPQVAVHTLVQQSWSQRCKVYRDFAAVAPRGPTGRPWSCEHTLHMKTNIPRRSNVKYRFHLEGYNWGTNTPVNAVITGFTGSQWESLNTMEDFGWPEGWDTRTVMNRESGIHPPEQYYTSDGVVALRLKAKSFIHVGFSVSAMLVTLDFGAGFPITVVFFHQADDL